MPGDPKECRIRSASCAQIAAETDNPELKQKFLDLAEQWLKLSADIETAQSLRVGLPPKV
jgi:hypothetical protein